MDRYRKIEKLGEGSYGIVYKAQCKTPFNHNISSNSSSNNGSNNIMNSFNSINSLRGEEGQIVALKRIRLSSGEEGIPATAIREISLLRELKHPNIVRLFDILHTENKLTLVFEYLDNDLRKYMDTQTPIDTSAYLDLIKGFVYQLLQGISYCHEKMVVHRDLKPQNLLISRRGELKIADFGLARSISAPLTVLSTDVVTLWYRSPDILLGNSSYGSSVDMWAIGCIIGEMINKEPLFQGKDKVDQFITITKVLGKSNLESWNALNKLPGIKDDDGKLLMAANIEAITSSLVNDNSSSTSLQQRIPGIDAEGFDLIRQLLRYAPEERISAKEAIAHPWFDSVKDRYTFMYDNY